MISNSRGIWIPSTSAWSQRLIQILLWMTLVLAQPPTLAHVGPARLADAPKHDLSHHALMLRDPSGKLTVEDVASLPHDRFERLESDISLGFTKDVVWVRLALSRTQADDPTQWLLVVGQTVLRDARLYTANHEGALTERRGTRFDRDTRLPITSRSPVFDVSSYSLAENVYWLKIQSPTAMNISLSAIQTKVFLEKTGFENFIWGLLFGGYILTIIFYLLFWIWTKEHIHQLYIFYIGVNFLSGFFTGGWPIILFESLTSFYLIIFLGIFISLSIYTGTAFSSKFIGLESKTPRLNKILNYSSLMAAITGIIFIVNGHYHFIMPFIQGYSVILIVIFMISSSYYSFKGDAKARYFLFAFSFFYIGIIWRYLRNTAVIEPNFLNENIYQIAAFVHMIVMSVGIFANYNKLKKDKNRAEIRAQTEAKLRLEQREFLSLVSHEFRTPLTIAGVSADNLLQQTDLSKESRHRVEKIVRANERITSLMDTYLSKERLIMDTHDIHLENHDISEICRLAINDMPNPEQHLVKLTFNRKIIVNCDAGLIRIAINNLLQNVLKFSPEPGSIELKITTQGDFSFITISDKGPGIPEDEISMIFTRYYRGKNALNTPGAGLGLHLIQTIVLRHGGSVSAQNLKPNGCEFSISLPL